jgi:hypothetical protein
MVGRSAYSTPRPTPEPVSPEPLTKFGLAVAAPLISYWDTTELTPRNIHGSLYLMRTRLSRSCWFEASTMALL